MKNEQKRVDLEYSVYLKKDEILGYVVCLPGIRKKTNEEGEIEDKAFIEGKKTA